MTQPPMTSNPMQDLVDMKFPFGAKKELLRELEAAKAVAPQPTPGNFCSNSRNSP